jgi:hypothetical protein
MKMILKEETLIKRTHLAASQTANKGLVEAKSSFLPGEPIKLLK